MCTRGGSDCETFHGSLTHINTHTHTHKQTGLKAQLVTRSACARLLFTCRAWSSYERWLRACVEMWQLFMPPVTRRIQEGGIFMGTQAGVLGELTLSSAFIHPRASSHHFCPSYKTLLTSLLMEEKGDLWYFFFKYKQLHVAAELTSL